MEYLFKVLIILVVVYVAFLLFGMMTRFIFKLAIVGLIVGIVAFGFVDFDDLTGFFITGEMEERIGNIDAGMLTEPKTASESEMPGLEFSEPENITNTTDSG